MENRPRVGVATVIKNHMGNFLLGHRLSDLGKNTWGLPGGKLDFSEDIKYCAVRELKEETGLIVNTNDLKLVGVSNAIFDNETHYITIIFEASKFTGKPTIIEPDKCSEWNFFSNDNLPENLFLPLKNWIDDIKKI